VNKAKSSKPINRVKALQAVLTKNCAYWLSCLALASRFEDTAAIFQYYFSIMLHQIG